MLDLQRLRSGQLSIKTQFVNIASVLTNVVQQCSTYTSRAIHLDLTGVPSPMRYVYTDRGRLTQILTNGLTNAIQHAPDGDITLSGKVMSWEEGKDLLFRLRQEQDERDKEVMEVLAGKKRADTPPTISEEADASAHLPSDAVPVEIDDIGVATGEDLKSNSPHVTEGSRGVLQVTISDHGEGFRGVSVKELFRPFTTYQYHKGSSPSPSPATPHSDLKTGLGLPICSLISVLMKGAVSLTEREDGGQGCVFTLVLPVELSEDGVQWQKAGENKQVEEMPREESEDQVEPVSMVAGSRSTWTEATIVAADVSPKPQDSPTTVRESKLTEPGPPSIPLPSDDDCIDLRVACPEDGSPRSLSLKWALVVDDDVSNVRMAARMLKLQGFAVHGIHRGNIPGKFEEALRKAGHMETPSDADNSQFPCGHGYDIVFLDIRLGPAWDGTHILPPVLAQVKHSVPVIAMTANTREADVQVYQSCGFSGLLGKPIGMAKLKRVLRSFYSQDRDGSRSSDGERWCS